MCLVLDQNRRASFKDLYKIFQFSHTENPETEEAYCKDEIDGFSEDDVRKCSFYLEFVKSLSQLTNES